MPKLGTLAAVLGGLDSAAKSAGTAYLQDKYLKDLLQKAEKEKRSLLEGIEELQESQAKDPLQRSLDWLVKGVGDRFGIQLGNYKELTDNALKEQVLVDAYIKKNKLPKNKETRSAVKNHIKTSSPKELSQEFGVPLPQEEKEPIRKPSFEEKHPTLSSFKELLTRDPLSLQTYKDAAAVVAKTPSRLGRYLMDALGGLDELRLKSLEKQGLVKEGPTLAEELSPVSDKLEEAEGRVDAALGADPNAKSNEALEMVVDTLSLPGARLAKGGNLLTRSAKNAAKGAATGAGYGALYGGGDPDSMKIGAALGGALHTALGAKASKAQKELQKIKGRANVKDPEEILKRAKLMGKEATIPEIVGDEKLINELKRDTSKANISRMEAIEGNIKKASQKAEEAFPKKETLDLYRNLEGLQKEVRAETDRLYGVVKETGVGKEAILDRSTMTDWVKAMKEAAPNIKGLPKMKPTGGTATKQYLNSMDMVISRSPTDQKGYRDFMLHNVDQLPTATDFLDFGSKIRKMLEKADSSQVVGLTNLKASLDRIVEKAGSSSSLKKAKTHYATKGASLNQTEIGKAIKAGKFSASEKGKPSISQVFGKQSIENSQLFEQLPPKDKQRVIGAFVEEVLKTGEKHPARVIQEVWKKLPDYIKETSDAVIQKILKEMETIAHTNKTLSSLQQSTTSSIGSRQSVEKLRGSIRPAFYGGSLLSGHPTVTGAVAVADASIKGSGKIRNAALRRRLSQKNLKYYLKPELLAEMNRNIRIPYALGKHSVDDEG
jgi:hypothetical protein